MRLQHWSVPNGKNRNKLKISFINLSVFDGVLTCFIFHLFGGILVLDITGIDIAAIVTGFGSLGGCIAAGVKAIKSGNEARAAKAQTELIQEQRKAQTELRDEQVQELKTGLAVVQEQIKTHANRLNDGDEKFEAFAGELKEQNGLLREILVALKIKFDLPIGKELGK